MPQGYDVPESDRGSIHEQLLGKGDDERTTKTFIEDGPLAMYLGFVRGFPDDIINTGRRMHAELVRRKQAEEKGVSPLEIDMEEIFEQVSSDEILRMYPEVRTIIGLHQQIVKHKGSQAGFLVNSWVGKDKSEQEAEKKKKEPSSGETKKTRWN